MIIIIIIKIERRIQSYNRYPSSIMIIIFGTNALRHLSDEDTCVRVQLRADGLRSYGLKMCETDLLRHCLDLVVRKRFHVWHKVNGRNENERKALRYSRRTS